jgi:hypothetical protein
MGRSPVGLQLAGADGRSAVYVGQVRGGGRTAVVGSHVGQRYALSLPFAQLQSSNFFCLAADEIFVQALNSFQRIDFFANA